MIECRKIKDADGRLVGTLEIESEYPVDRSNSTIGEGTTCHDKFRLSL